MGTEFEQYIGNEHSQINNQVDEAFELPNAIKARFELQVIGKSQAELDEEIHALRQLRQPGLRREVSIALGSEEQSVKVVAIMQAWEQARIGCALKVARAATRMLMDNNRKSNF